MKAIMYLQKNNRYELEDCPEIICFLALFLTDDIRVSLSRCNDLRRWLENSGYTGRGGNYAFLEKCGDDILISEDWAEEDDPKLVISKSEFLNILDEWEKVCKEKPKEVIITEENGKYTFEKKN